jgi:hypothetical protein
MTLLKSVKTFDARLQCAQGKANSTCTVTSSWMCFQSVEANPSPLLSPIFARACIQLAGTVTPNTLSDWQIDDHDLISHGIKTLSKQVNFGPSVLGDTLYSSHAYRSHAPAHSLIRHSITGTRVLLIYTARRARRRHLRQWGKWMHSGKTTSNIVS